MLRPITEEVFDTVPARKAKASAAPAAESVVTPLPTAAAAELSNDDYLKIVITALEDLKAKDISVLDVRGRTSVTDFMVIASGTSNRHVKSLADNVVDEVKNNGRRPLGVEGGATNDWVLVDLGDIVVHVMMPATREFYDLERFWRDAPAPGSLGS